MEQESQPVAELVIMDTRGLQWASSNPRIEAALASRPGVLSVDANAVAQTASVTFDPARTSVSALVGWIRECGLHCAGQSVPGHLSEPLAEPGPEAKPHDEGHDRHGPASDEAGRRTLWKARHDALWAVKYLGAGRDVVVTDVAVPLSNLAAAVRETAEDVVLSGLLAPIVGHVGDGNFHAIVVFDAADPTECARVEAFLDRLVARALAYDGTATGEHGIGQGKRRYMQKEHGEALGVMRAIKHALDPLNILNPCKII